VIIRGCLYASVGKTVAKLIKMNQQNALTWAADYPSNPAVEDVGIQQISVESHPPSMQE
jgi:hypothetical protein